MPSLVLPAAVRISMTPAGLVQCQSRLGPKETMDRLAAAVGEHGMTVLARIDHAAAAAKAGLELRPTEVLIFGNPHGGTPLMEAVQTGSVRVKNSLST